MQFLRRKITKMIESIRLSCLFILYSMKQKRYLEVYRKRMDKQIKLSPRDSRWRPKTARWEKAGNIQFQFLVQEGLKPEHSLLDTGCGPLRGGIKFVKYLAPGNYTGIDVSREAIKCACQLVDEEDLTIRRPRLLVTSDSRFKELEGETFDFIWAYDVLFHLPPEEIEEIFKNIGNIMGRNSKFYFTFKPSSRPKAAGKYNFRYPFSYFHKLAEENGLSAELLEPPSAYHYPRRKRMVRITKGE